MMSKDITDAGLFWGEKNKMYRDHGRSKDETTSAEQSGNTRLGKGVSAPPGEVDTLVENAVFGADEVREHSQEKIRQFASAHGVVLNVETGRCRQL